MSRPRRDTRTLALGDARAFQAGQQAAREGHPEEVCPYFDAKPFDSCSRIIAIRRKRWIAGFRSVS